jgi:N-acetylmuramoyl-L-alanine amidase
MQPRLPELNVRRRFGLALGVVASLMLASPGWPVSLRDIRTEVNDTQGYTRCVIELTGKTEFLHRDFVAQKSYFLIDIYDVKLAVPERFITPASGPVRQVFVFNRKGPDSQVLTLVFYLTDPRRYRVVTQDNPFRIIVDVRHTAEPTLTPASPAAAALAGPAGSALKPGTGGRDSENLIVPGANVGVVPGRMPWTATRKKSGAGKTKVVIIDPGHGGADPGALSRDRINGDRVQEKDINLTVSTYLKRLIDASPNMEAFMTREDDRRVELDDRVKYIDTLRHALKREDFYGDLFISIHCNATGSRGDRTARGIEFYFLNPNATETGATRYIERLENDMLNGASTVNFQHPILKRLAEDAIEQQNIDQAQQVSRYLLDSCYRIDHFRRNNNREKAIQSGRFRVLFQADMPAVLAEIGFLTNTEDCKMLVNPRFQQQVAIALYNGIASYFKAQDQGFQPVLLALPAQ